nr:MAG TPA: hypothetical protein [Crassvirales sp.]
MLFVVRPYTSILLVLLQNVEKIILKSWMLH